MKSKPTRTTIIAFFTDQEGVTAIEYALLGALVAVAILVGVSAIGTNVEKLYNDVAAIVASVMP